jgi:hypothetical protein
MPRRSMTPSRVSRRPGGICPRGVHVDQQYGGALSVAVPAQHTDPVGDNGIGDPPLAAIDHEPVSGAGGYGFQRGGGEVTGNMFDGGRTRTPLAVRIDDEATRLPCPGCGCLP